MAQFEQESLRQHLEEAERRLAAMSARETESERKDDTAEKGPGNSIFDICAKAGINLTEAKSKTEVIELGKQIRESKVDINQLPEEEIDSLLALFILAL